MNPTITKKDQTPFLDHQDSAVRRYLFALAVVAAAAGLRVWPLGALELRIPWVTFYPAVMATALYGGFSAGLLATVLTAVLVLFWSPTDEPFIDDSGDVLGMAVFCVNGTLISLMSGAMHRAKARATMAREQAERANQAKSAFLANISHELRTPLNAILGFTSIMRSDPEASPEQKKKLSIVGNSGESLLALINNVLDISKIEAGHMVKEEADVDLKHLLHELESLLSAKAREKGLNFKLAMTPGLPDIITVDTAKLSQVLTNLIGNAIKYTPTGEVSLKAMVAQEESSSLLRLRFEVEDSGIGICEDDLDVIFTPFEQIDNQPDAESGTGLGLAICRQYVELMDGVIGVDSEPGKGSRFYFEIPTRTPTLPVKVRNVHADKRVTGLEEGQKRFRILIAEDSFENRLLLHSLLEPFDFEIREAVNGREAIEKFEHWRPHLIWMDIRMPEMDGMEATRRIKATEPGAKTKIIALTAHALEEERLQILAAGCDELIRKPYRDMEIFGALTKHLGIRFLYAEEAETPKEKPLDEGKLNAVPPDLIVTLRAASELLDQEQSSKVAGMISDHDNELGEHLRRMVENLRFKEILAAVERMPGTGGAK